MNSYIKNQIDRKDNSATNVLLTAGRTFGADANSAYGQIRSQNLLDMQNTVGSYNTAARNDIQHDMGLTRRQFEINEYHYYNKLDTLFFLQLFFIAVMVMSVLIYFNRRGTLTAQMTGILTAVLAILLILVGVSRYFYTTRTRDRRLWHRRYFQSESEPRPALINSCPGSPSSATEINLNAIFDNSQISCALETNKNFQEWKTAANKEAERQMKGETLPASIFAASGFARGPSCKKN